MTKHNDVADLITTELSKFATFKEAFRFLTALADGEKNEGIEVLLSALRLLAADNMFHLLPTDAVGYFKFQKLRDGRIIILPASAGMSKALFAHNVCRFCDWLGEVKPDLPREIAHKFARAGGMFYAPRTKEMADHYDALYKQSIEQPATVYQYSRYRVVDDEGVPKHLISRKTAASLASAVGLIT